MIESKEYKTILVGTDGSEQAQNAFEKAIEVAKRNHATIILAYVNENRIHAGTLGMVPFTPDVLQADAKQVEQLLESYKEIAKQKEFESLTTTMVQGSPKTMMAKELPKEYNVDLIMVGQSGLNAVERLVLGSVSDYIIRNAPCDVLVVRSDSND